jgi:hypothetical protein
MSKPLLMLAVVMISALAQQVGPKVPPPGQPQEPVAAGESVEVRVWFGGQPAQGLQVSLWELGPGGRLLPPKVRPFTVMTDATGMVRWTNLGSTVWVVRVQGKDGFSLALPITESYLAAPLQVGSYRIEVRRR